MRAASRSAVVTLELDTAALTRPGCAASASMRNRPPETNVPAGAGTIISYLVSLGGRRSGRRAKALLFLRCFLLGLLFRLDRKSTRLNSSHDQISYAVF